MSELAILGGPSAVRRPIGAYRSIGDDERAAVDRVLRSGCLSGFYGSPGPEFFGGEEVQRLEREWERRYGIAHAVSVNSATSGLFAAMAAIGISPGDEVIVPPYTMSATVVAPLLYGGIPVFVDIEPRTFCIDPDLVEAAISPRTKAIVAVNLFGHPAELERLRNLADERGIFLIEDSAQAPLGAENGRPCGTVGHIGVFSLNYHKHIHSGEGGICVTSDAKLARRLQLVRNHGENVVAEENDDLSNMIGFNYRMSEIHAAISSVQLDNAERHVSLRERAAAILADGTRDLEGWTVPHVRPGCRHNYYMFTVRLDDEVLGVSRGTFSRALAAEGFPNEVGYVQPQYRLPMFRKRKAIGKDNWPFSLTDRKYDGVLCPVAERLHEREVLQFQVPSWDVSDDVAAELVAAVRKVHRKRGELKRLDNR